MAKVKKDDTAAVAPSTQQHLAANSILKKDLDKQERRKLREFAVVDLSSKAAAVATAQETETLEEINTMRDTDEEEVLRLIPLAEKELKEAIAHYENAAKLDRQTTVRYQRMTRKMDQAINRMKKAL